MISVLNFCNRLLRRLKTEGTKYIRARFTQKRFCSNAPIRHSDAFYEKYRYIGDPIADNLLTQLFASHQTSAFCLSSLLNLKNNQLPPNDLPPVLYDFYASPIVYPSWYDEERVLNAQHFASKHLPQIALTLVFHSLPFSYGFRGAKLLKISENLTQNVNGRTLRTSQFVLDVLMPNSFDLSTGHGIRTTQTIRLIHAAIRYHHTENYLTETRREYTAINQTELLNTLYGAFYHCTLKGIEKCGVDYTEQERKDYMHLWSVIGYFLGIDEELLIIDNDYRVVTDKLLVNCMKYELDLNLKVSKPLTDALVVYLKDLVPFEFADDVVYSILRWYLGDEWCDTLQLRKGPDIKGFVMIAKALNMAVDEAGDQNKMMARIIGKLSTRFMRKWFQILAREERVPYYLEDGGRSSR